MILFTTALILLLLFTLGAFFSAAETAITALSPIDINDIQKGKDSRASAQLKRLLEQPDRLIASLLIGNNIANISASALVTYVLNLYWGGLIIALGTLILSLIIIIFCEIAPKQIALLHKKKIALLLVWPVTIIYNILLPILYITMHLTKTLLPILRKKKYSEDLSKSLDHMVELATENGVISSYEREFINNVLELDDKTVREIMTHRKDVFSVSNSKKLTEVYPKMVENSYSRIPVYKDQHENIIGILYMSDLQKLFIQHNYIEGKAKKNTLYEQQQQFENFAVGDLLKPVTFLPDTIKVSDLFFHFKQNEGNLVIIIDEYGGFAGVASQEDVLETVFGKLYDEDESAEKLTMAIRQEKQSYIFSGLLSIQQFEQFFNVEIEDNLSIRRATMSGHLCDLIEMIPEKGKSIETDWGTFHVLESDGKRIVRLSYKPTP